MFRAITAVVAGLACATSLVVSAQAAKPEQPLADIQCGDTTYQAPVSDHGNGNNDFTPAHLVGGGLLIPVAFSNQHGTFTDSDGNVFTDDPPDVSHPTPGNKTLLSCSFVVTFSDETGSGTFTGDVTAFLVARH